MTDFTDSARELLGEVETDFGMMMDDDMMEEDMEGDMEEPVATDEASS
ncbi:MAG: hypothetical protein AAF653_03475 [Chloroflexota bacterium]